MVRALRSITSSLESYCQIFLFSLFLTYTPCSTCCCGLEKRGHCINWVSGVRLWGCLPLPSQTQSLFSLFKKKTSTWLIARRINSWLQPSFSAQATHPISRHGKSILVFIWSSSKNNGLTPRTHTQISTKYGLYNLLIISFVGQN